MSDFNNVVCLALSKLHELTQNTANTKMRGLICNWATWGLNLSFVMRNKLIWCCLLNWLWRCGCSKITESHTSCLFFFCLLYTYAHTPTHTYSDVHWLLWRDNMSRQCGEGKSWGAVLLAIYILHLHLFWRHSAGSQTRRISVVSVNHSLLFSTSFSQRQSSLTCWHTRWSDQNQW